MSSLDDARNIALEFAQRQNPNVMDMKVSSAKRSGDKWIVEISWPIENRVKKIIATQYLQITVNDNRQVVGYEPESHGVDAG